MNQCKWDEKAILTPKIIRGLLLPCIRGGKITNNLLLKNN